MEITGIANKIVHNNIVSNFMPMAVLPFENNIGKNLNILFSSPFLVLPYLHLTLRTLKTIPFYLRRISAV
jgi:hypothetical protein